MAVTTTIYNSDGTTTVVHNRSGKTIQTVTPTGSTAATAAQISHHSQHDIVFVPPQLETEGVGPGGIVPSSINTGVMLPADAEIGDVVEVYALPTSSPPVTDPVTVYAQPTTYLPSGNTLNGGSASSGVGIGKFLKVSATNWINPY